AVLASCPSGATLSHASAPTRRSSDLTFTGLTINGAAGDYTLRFESSPLTPATSGTITLSAGTATQLTITTEPSPTATSGAPLSPHRVAQVWAAAGNPAGRPARAVTAE